MNYNKIREALEGFVACINDTGGVTRDPKGHTVPVVDGEWIDLGHAYLKACEFLEVTPVWEPQSCDECGCPFQTDASGISQHIMTSREVDYDRDRDHVPYSVGEEEKE